MRRIWAAMFVLASMAAAVPHSRGGAEESVIRSFYFPPDDPQQGTLMDESVKLLDRLQRLPARVNLGPARDVKKASVRPPGSAGPRWIRVPVGPVGSLFERAEAYMAAGRFEQASRAYSRAACGGDGAAHAAVMAAICEMRTGGGKDAVGLLRRAASLREAKKDWFRWAEQLNALTSEIRELEVNNGN